MPPKKKNGEEKEKRKGAKEKKVAKLREYQASWESTWPWLKPARRRPGCISPDKNKGYCTLCKCTIQPKKTAVADHAKSAKQKGRETVVQSTDRNAIPTIVRRPHEVNKTKEAEVKLAAHIACHSALLTADHLSVVVKSLAGPMSPLRDVRLHRTKCTKIITEVIAPVLQADLKSDLGGRKYSLFIDESTDVSSEKGMAVVIRYFSKKNHTRVDVLLALRPILHTTGEAVFELLSQIMDEFGLKFKNLHGLGVDGASSMVGEHDSVWSRVRAKNPNVILFKCVCHSLAKVAEYGFNKLPSCLSLLLSDIPTWFRSSAIRRDEFKKLKESFYEEEEETDDSMCYDDKSSLPFTRFNTTRWLVRGKVIKNILNNWRELVRYFDVQKEEATGAAKAKALMIHQILTDPINRMYLLCASAHIDDLESLNRLFQSDKVRPEKLHDDLALHMRKLKSDILDREGRLRPLNLVIFPGSFSIAVQEYLNANKQRPDLFESAQKRVSEVKQRCREMIQEFLNQMKMRVTKTQNVFAKLDCFRPAECLSQVKRTSFHNLPNKHLMADQTKVDNQWSKFVLVNWREEPVFAEGIPTDSIEFWLGVSKKTDSLGHYCFPELCDYVFNCLTVPVSNAIVERIFSGVTYIKNKYRNRMGYKTLESILRIRFTLIFANKCCVDFRVTDAMLARFKSATMYIDAEEGSSGANAVEVMDTDSSESDETDD